MLPLAQAEVNVDPEVEATFQEGIGALQEERLKTAIRAFSKILDINPRLHRAKLELALAYYRSLRYEKAEKLAKEVLDNPATPPEVRVTILAFLAQVKRDSQQYGQKNAFKPFISGGVMHDSNVNVGPNDSISGWVILI
ncbi:tetratricopeptide repeat protein [Thiogranum longum]|uniref:tetratricopeptide repeat protein n=1 Tax=Thiogranum longum TaxID=1537524 RepID=UPI001A9EC1E4|nr:tetratricopeptide repeat protein [Thiogranum longum]